jgi:hypothetical protein
LNAESFGKTDLFISENANPQEIIQLLKNAYEYFSKYSVKEAYKISALKLVAKYLTKVGKPQDQNAFNAATLYVVNRLPASEPNHESKKEWSERLNVTKTSLEWYVSSIVDNLGFLTLRDRKNFPYYVERDSVVFAVVSAVVKGYVEEAIVQRWAEVKPFDVREVVDQILDVLIIGLKIIPAVFRRDLGTKIENDIQEELAKARISL